MSRHKLIVYEPPAPGYPFLAVATRRGQVVFAEAARTRAAAEALLERERPLFISTENLEKRLGITKTSKRNAQRP